MKTINRISFSKLSNAYHVSFLSAIKADIDKYGKTDDGPNIGISKKLYDAYVEQLDKEQEIVNRTRSSEYTPLLLSYDKARDSYFRRLYYKLKIAEGDSMNEQITPELINIIQERLLNAYPLSITSDAVQKETAKLRGFIKDVRDYLTESQITMLHLSEDLTQLGEANDNYEKTYVVRSSDIARNADTSVCREASEQLYINVILSIQTLANAIIDPKDDEAQIHADFCNACIDDINQIIKDFKYRAYPSSAADEDEEETENEEKKEPEKEPETPKDENPNPEKKDPEKDPEAE